MRLTIPNIIISIGLMLTLSACSVTQQDALFNKVVELGRGAANLTLNTSLLDDVEMTYLERQGSGPVMLLIHGFSANKDTWIQFAAELPDDYRLIVPDLAGHGDTPAPKGEDYNLIRQAERLHQLMANLNVEQLHIAGNSMGGAISAIYAAMYPEQVTSLTLIDAAGVDAPQPSEYMIALDKGQNPLIATDEASFEFRMDFVMSKAPPLPWPLRPALMRQTIERADINQEIFSDMIATRDELLNIGFEQQLSERVTMPTLIIWGDEDRVLDVSAVDVFKEKIPHAQVKIYEGIGHLPMVEIPEQTAILFSEFVASNE